MVCTHNLGSDIVVVDALFGFGFGCHRRLWVDICLRERRLWYVRAIRVPILQKTFVEECIDEMRLYVRKRLWVGGYTCYLGT